VKTFNPTIRKLKRKLKSRKLSFPKESICIGICLLWESIAGVHSFPTQQRHLIPFFHTSIYAHI